MGLSQQEYYSGLPFPTPGNLSYSGIKPTFLASPVLTDSLPTAPPGKPLLIKKTKQNKTLR